MKGKQVIQYNVNLFVCFLCNQSPVPPATREIWTDNKTLEWGESSYMQIIDVTKAILVIQEKAKEKEKIEGYEKVLWIKNTCFFCHYADVCLLVVKMLLYSCL